MTRDVLRELIPINLICVMVVAGVQYYRSALRQPAAMTDALADSLTGLPAIHPFWLLPAAAGIIYIVVTVLQFLRPDLFLPKTLVIFALADLHAALLYRDIGVLDSVLLGMAPALLAGAIYASTIVARRLRNTHKGSSP